MIHEQANSFGYLNFIKMQVNAHHELQQAWVAKNNCSRNRSRFAPHKFASPHFKDAIVDAGAPYD